MKKNEVVSVLRWPMLLVAVVALAGCGDNGNLAWGTSAGHAGNPSALVAQPWIGEREVVRITTDPARRRLWVLGLDDVRVYDTVTQQLVKRIALPGWSVARFICLPDMTLDRSGTAWVSSNVLPKLWRIDADGFKVSEHEILLSERENLDMGFGSLAFGADGTLIGLTCMEVALWKIDVGQASASLIGLGAGSRRL